MAAKDPYRFYRPEARELLDGLLRGVLDLEKGAAQPEPVARLLRLAHTLKGAARVVKQMATAEAAHSFEGMLAPLRGGGAVPRETTQELLRLLDRIKEQLDALSAAAQPAAAPRAGAEGREDRAGVRPSPGPLPEVHFETVRVDITDMDLLLHSVSEVGVQLSALRQRAAEFAHSRVLADAIAGHLAPRAGRVDGVNTAGFARVRGLLDELRASLDGANRSLAAGLDRSDAELQQTRDKAHTLRLLPAGTVFAPLERAVRDVARALGKEIAFEASGGDHRLDGHVLGPLADALLHIVRNAADHGIESPAERAAASKPPRGRIELSVERVGARLVFACRDDGRGLDVSAIRRAAVRAGRIPDADAASLDLDGAVTLLLGGGLSTAGRVTEISGRGIGLDIVRDAAARLKGVVEVQSTPGRGTRVRIGVPLSLSSIPVLVVQAAGVCSCVPLESVRRTVRLAPEDIARAPHGDTIVYAGQVVPFLSLAQLWDAAAAVPAGAQTALVIEGRGSHVAVGIERLSGSTDIVLRPLPPQLGAVPGVIGAAFDAQGDPLPVLDAEGLVQAARSGASRRAAPAPMKARPAILIVDDSLTTRMLEQSILEAEGYDVGLAASGEEGLHKARQRGYNLFLVDIEMPGMDGFDFIERVRADPALSHVPSILVSSIATPESRRRGEEVGARAYIAKGEFDQARFLETVRDLAG